MSTATASPRFSSLVDRGHRQTALDRMPTPGTEQPGAHPLVRTHVRTYTHTHTHTHKNTHTHTHTQTTHTHTHTHTALSSTPPWRPTRARAWPRSLRRRVSSSRPYVEEIFLFPLSFLSRLRCSSFFHASELLPTPSPCYTRENEKKRDLNGNGWNREMSSPSLCLSSP